MREDPDPKYSIARVVGLLGTIPLILAVAPLVGYFLGSLLDRWLHTGWVLRLVFLGLGFVAGIREMLRLLKAARHEFEKL
jgi:ATP synthase protein I